jgi:hypothetical protein
MTFLIGVGDSGTIGGILFAGCMVVNRTQEPAERSEATGSADRMSEAQLFAYNEAVASPALTLSLFELRQPGFLICPTGKSEAPFGDALSSPFCKNILVFRRGKSL